MNSRTLNGLDGFSLHYILIKSKEGDSYIINDPGGGTTPAIEDRKVSKKLFMKAFGGKGAGGEVTGFRIGLA